MSHAIIRVGIIYKINNFDRVDLVSNNKRKIGTQNWKTWVADKCKKEFQQKVYYQEHGINNRGKKATSYKRKIRLMLLLLGRLFLIFCSTFFWVITQQLSFFFQFLGDSVLFLICQCNIKGIIRQTGASRWTTNTCFPRFL